MLHKFLQLPGRQLGQHSLHAAVIGGQLVTENGDISARRFLHDTAALLIQNGDRVDGGQVVHFLGQADAGNLSAMLAAQQIVGFQGQLRQHIPLLVQRKSAIGYKGRLVVCLFFCRHKDASFLLHLPSMAKRLPVRQRMGEVCCESRTAFCGRVEHKILSYSL